MAPTRARGGRSGPFGAGAGATGSIGGATTARGGARREAEKIGRAWVAESTERGTDHSGLPTGSGFAASSLGGATGATRPISTVSDPFDVRSSERISSVEDVAAGN